MKIIQNVHGMTSLLLRLALPLAVIHTEQSKTKLGKVRQCGAGHGILK
jgi:hypothetical protein